MDKTTLLYVLTSVALTGVAISVLMVVNRRSVKKNETKHKEQVDRLKNAIEVMDILNEDLEEEKKRDNQK